MADLKEMAQAMTSIGATARLDVFLNIDRRSWVASMITSHGFNPHPDRGLGSFASCQASDAFWLVKIQSL